MADIENDERTEDATEMRREEFRKRGQVAQTRELSSVLVLLGSALMFWGLGKYFLSQLLEIFSQTYTEQLIVAARNADWRPAILFVVTKGLLIAGPLWGLYFIIGFASSIIQTGLLNNEEALNLDWNRINPVEGLKRLVSLRALIEGLKAIVKVAVVLTIMYFTLRSEIQVLPRLSNFNVQQMIQYVGQCLLKILAVIGVFMSVVAVADYFFQWWELEKQMRMTKQEVKEEHKSREGDPMIKARIRRIQKDMANKRMMEKVPKADVVITNPTHIAVALKYDANMIAPELVAKGAGLIAEKIKALAKENRVPIVENKPLARTIFKTMKIGQGIPRELFTAVAKVLSYVYRLKGKTVN